MKKSYRYRFFGYGFAFFILITSPHSAVYAEDNNTKKSDSQESLPQSSGGYFGNPGTPGGTPYENPASDSEAGSAGQGYPGGGSYGSVSPPVGQSGDEAHWYEQKSNETQKND